MEPIRLALVFHLHQPVGNFGEVFLEAYERCYEPFLSVLEEAEDLPFTLHVSGPLLEWLEARRPAFVERLRGLASSGRMELLSGGFYEPILPALSREDRLAQLELMRRRLEDLFGLSPRGCWLAERVWEPGLVPDLEKAGVIYTLLDDHLLEGAGFRGARAMRPFLAEEGGSLLRILPISERLRYLVPFQSPEALLEELDRARERGGKILVYGDDAEKFGVWPGTYQLVYEKGWLKEAFRLLVSSPEVVTLSTAWEALRDGPAPQPAEIPAGSYREMEEWAAPRVSPSLAEVRKRLQADPEGEKAAAVFLRGGTWRRFLTRYPESRRIHGRVCRAGRMIRSGEAFPQEEALQELLRAQCNCAYWHGVFGGIYLTHLRDALYRHLLLAESAYHGRKKGQEGKESRKSLLRLEADFDLDGRQETALVRPPFQAFLKPDLGGRLFEFSHLDAAWNPLLCLSRKIETYHEEIPRRQREEAFLGEDPYPLDCLEDRILPGLPGAEDWFRGRVPLEADLSVLPYEETWRGDLAAFSPAPVPLGAGETLHLEKSLEIGDRGMGVTYRVSRKGNPENRKYLAVSFHFGPGNQGGASLLKGGDRQWRVENPALEDAPPTLVLEGITRGDVVLSQTGADKVLTGPIWSLFRDEKEVKKNLQGTRVVLFFPLEPVEKEQTFSLELQALPWD